MKKWCHISAAFLVAAMLLGLLGCRSYLSNPLEAEYPEDLSSYLTYPDPSSVILEGWEPVVTEEDVEAQVMIARSKTSKLEAAGRPAEKGDYVVLDYFGYVDGELNEAFCGEDSESVIGYGLYLKEIEEAVLGATEGKVVRVTAHLDDPYLPDLTYSGREVVFVIQVKEVDAQILEEYNDAWVQQNAGFSSVRAFEEALRQALEEGRKAELNSYLGQKAWEELYARTEFLQLPEEVWEKEFAEGQEYYRLLAEYREMTPEELRADLGYESEEAFLEFLRNTVSEKIRQRLLLLALARDFDLRISESDFQTAEEGLVQALGLAGVEALESLYDYEDIYETVLLQFCMNELRARAQVHERT